MAEMSASVSHRSITLFICLVFFSTASSNLYAAAKTRKEQAKETEVWQPVPPIVKAAPGNAPSDAMVLFDGTDLQHWRGEDTDQPGWRVVGNELIVVPGAGDILSKASFCDIQLHLEWRTPKQTSGLHGQKRGNSGVFFQDRYEVQILDSYNNVTYSNGQAAALYKQSIPLVNASRPPGVWQSYDIIFIAPKFNQRGELEAKARLTVFHNGVLVQHDVTVEGSTVHIGKPTYTAHGCAPLRLQDHKNPVGFRNIWVRRLD